MARLDAPAEGGRADEAPRDEAPTRYVDYAEVAPAPERAADSAADAE